MKLAGVLLLTLCTNGRLAIAAGQANKTGEEEVWKTDECGRPLYKIPPVQTCHATLHFNAYKKRCKSFPSSPRKLKHSFAFNQSSQELNLMITWDEPEYGENTLWGYDIILSDSHHSMERCHQVSGERLLYKNFTFKGIGFNKCLFVMVISLPRRNRGMKNSIESLIRSPDICTYFKNLTIATPFACAKLENLTLVQSCNGSGSAIISWRPPVFDIDEIFAEVHSSCSKEIKDIRIDKSAPDLLLEDLQLGCKHFVQMHLVSKMDGIWRISAGSTLKFDCLAPRTLGKRQVISHSPRQVSGRSITTDSRDLIIYPSISILVLATIVFALIYGRKRRRGFRGERDTHPILETQMSNEIATSVMLLHGAGCEYLREFALIFASILNANGLRVRLDLMEANLIAQMNMPSYYECAERESDYVIIIGSHVLVPDCTSCKAYNFILGIIKHHIMDQDNRSKYIPVYFDDLSSLPVALRGFAKRIPDDLNQILAMLLGIPTYVISSEAMLPVKNEVIMRGHLNSLEVCINNVLEKVHSSCPTSQCKRGTLSPFATRDLDSSFPDIPNRMQP